MGSQRRTKADKGLDNEEFQQVSTLLPATSGRGRRNGAFPTSDNSTKERLTCQLEPPTPKLSVTSSLISHSTNSRLLDDVEYD